IFLQNPQRIFNAVRQAELNSQHRVIYFSYVKPDMDSIILFEFFQYFRKMSVFKADQSLTPTINIKISDLLYTHLASFQHCLIRGLQYELGVSCPDTNTAFYQCSLKLLCT